ncbi:hypothetical protein F5X96DRAFT_659383 [Biscogniauxia mediterranea]|nr:hypothetical protein F5X96DRAFT_659383 [Biscogniauxia mediterranea]
MPPQFNSTARRSLARVLQRTTANAQRSPSSRSLLQSTAGATRHYANLPLSNLAGLKLPDDYVPPTQPPSAKKPDQRKAQLLRSYTSMLRSTPLILFFQHNSINAVEFAAIRRELRTALAALPAPTPGPSGKVPIDISPNVEIQVLRTRIFDVAFRVVEFFDPKAHTDKPNAYTHDLSVAAYKAHKGATVDENSAYGQIRGLFTGPVAAVTIPMVSPAHLEAVLKVLAPSPPAFPPPPRKKNPGYYEPTAQSGLQKLLLIGGRIEGRVFDPNGVMWVGSIQGGLDGLRAQLVGMLQNAGLGLTSALEGNSKGLWLALESRRTQMEEEANGGKKAEEETTTATTTPTS